MESLRDVWKREGKPPSSTGGIGSVLKFFANVFIGLPLLVVVVLPVNLVASAVGRSSRSGDGSEEDEDAAFKPVPEVGDPIPLAERKFDVVVFGVTGFTGKFAARHIGKTYGSSISWAISGRNRSKLEAFREELAGIDPSLSDLPIIIADSAKEETLVDLVSDTRAVVTTVGPFFKYGTPVVRYCVAYGTHYADTTGELGWVRKVIENYAVDAERTGARIVHLCGQDVVPWDLLTLLLVEKLREMTGLEKPLCKLEMFDEIYGTYSGGTLATALGTLTRKPAKKSKLGFDPVDLANGERTMNRVKDKSPLTPTYTKARGWTTKFVMSSVNAQSIRRSNALLDYGDRIEFYDYQIAASFTAAWNHVLGLLIFGAAVLNPVIGPIMYNLGFARKPGEGPSESEMAKGYMLLHGIAHATNGSNVEGWCYFPRNTGYVETGRMVVESALAMALQADEIPRLNGGIYTPAPALGQTLVRRLVNTGTRFQIGEDNQS